MALEDERTLKMRVRNVAIEESCEWRSIIVSRRTNGIYRIEGYGESMEIGDGKFTVRSNQMQVISATIALWYRHLPVVMVLPRPRLSKGKPMPRPLPGFVFEGAA